MWSVGVEEYACLTAWDLPHQHRPDVGSWCQVIGQSTTLKGMYIWGSSELIFFVPLIPLHP